MYCWTVINYNRSVLCPQKKCKFLITIKSYVSSNQNDIPIHTQFTTSYTCTFWGVVSVSIFEIDSLLNNLSIKNMRKSVFLFIAFLIALVAAVVTDNVTG